MHKIILVVIASILASPAAAFTAEPGTRERTFLRALEVFDAAKTPQEYGESAALLDSLLADGFRNGAVYYNLGNAYFRAGEYGRAIAAYRKAKAYRPRDPYLEANLRQALSVAPGAASLPPGAVWYMALATRCALCRAARWRPWSAHQAFKGAGLRGGAMARREEGNRERSHARAAEGVGAPEGGGS